MKLVKSAYYFSSLLSLLFELESPWVVLKLLFGQSALLKFRRGFSLRVSQLIEILIVKECIIDDEYRIAILVSPKFIVDVGAGVGEFSVFAAKLYPAAQVIAFEPNKAQFEILQENIKSNQLRNVAAYNLAIATSSQVFLKADAQHVRARLDSTGVAVDAVRLEDYVTQPIDLLKVDTEGSELDVLKSLGGSLTELKRIALEYHNMIVPDQSSKLALLLSDAGYSVDLKPNKYDTNLGHVYAEQ